MFAAPTIARPTIPVSREVRKRMPEQWEVWFRRLTPKLKDFAPHHKTSGQWLQALKPEVRPVPEIDIWPRGHGKSTFAEHGVAYVAERKKRRFALYICATQDAAEIHVSNIQALLERIGGTVGRRLENAYGHSKGWKKTMLRTASGFNCAAFGLDQAMRGVKLENYRPDLIILDDVDGRHDTTATTKKKIEILTQSILPAGSDDLAVWGVQNLIIPNGIFSRLADGRADFLATRNVNGPIKAVKGLATEKRFIKTWKGHDLNRSIHIITGGEPTWEAFDLDVCQQEIIDLGWAAFDREKQNNVKDVEGALWTTDLINETRVSRGSETSHEKHTISIGDLTRVVVAVDPATTSKDSSDETGILGCGRTAERHGYVLEDDSGIRKPSEWGRAAVLMHDRIGASCIVGEANQGGEMVEDVIMNAARKLYEEDLRSSSQITVKLIHASKGKRARAEPVAQMYDEHTIHHVGSFPELEDQMTTWNASDGSESPDRVDALVWAMTELDVVKANRSRPVKFSNIPI